MKRRPTPSLTSGSESYQIVSIAVYKQDAIILTLLTTRGRH